MDLRLADDVFRRSPECLEAVQLYQQGHLRPARRRFGELAQSDEAREVAAFYIALIDRALAEANGEGWTLNLPAGAPPLWETDWLRAVFGGVARAEVVDDRKGLPADRSIIVDWGLNAEKEAYYRRNFEQGVRQVLVHLSDEAFADSCSAYRWCERVYRNYWSPILANLGHVSFFPLGYKVGFARTGAPPRPAAERRYLWSFAGNPKKSTRSVMLRHMRTLPDGSEHLTSGWNSADSLSTEVYRLLLDQSLFAPCPAGDFNLDSFRVYEALEAGCIPIIEARAGFAYFDRLLPGHPMPVVSHWSEAPVRVRSLLKSGEAEALRGACYAWWTGSKAGLVAQVRAELG